MLTILRKIRRKLIESQSTRKYLLYAIGEIALVVIGILIALQINNWNEWRKDRDREKKVLIQLSKNLQTNCDFLNNWMNNNLNANKNGDIIIEYFKNKLPYHDSIEVYFWSARLKWNEDLSIVGYESLKNVGFDIIENDLLREEVLNLFEVEYKSYHKSMKWGEADEGLQEQLIDQNFLRQPRLDNLRGNRFIPFQPNEVFNNQYLYSVYVKRIRQRRFYNFYMNRALSESKRVLQLIKDELGE